MAKDLWNDDEEEITGEYVQEGGGNFPVIPHETRVKACIDKAEWEVKPNYKDNEEEQDCVSVRFDIEDGEFKGQKIFKKFFMDSSDSGKNKEAHNMLMAIDFNAGGKLRALGRKPKDEELFRHLINKSMFIVVGMMEDKKTSKKQNYLMGVSSGKKPTEKPEPKREAASKAKPSSYGDMDDSDDIPF